MTNTSKLSLLTTLLVSLSATAAFADSPVAPIPQHQPENISQINGQLVKVGQHNKYDYSYKKYNIGTNPFGLMAGIVSGQASVALNSMVAIKGDMSLFTGLEFGKGAEVSASAAIYFRQMYSGVFREPGLMYRSLESSSDSGGNTHGSSSPRDITTGIQTLIGYHWMWDSGLNIALAYGIGRNLVADEDEYDSQEIFVNGYARFGYAF